MDLFLLDHHIKHSKGAKRRSLSDQTVLIKLDNDQIDR